jgi:hypothetical protein
MLATRDLRLEKRLPEALPKKPAKTGFRLWTLTGSQGCRIFLGTTYQS